MHNVKMREWKNQSILCVPKRAAYVNQEAEGSDDRRLRSNQRCVNSFDVVLTLAGRMLARTLSHIPELLTRAGHRTQGEPGTRTFTASHYLDHE